MARVLLTDDAKDDICNLDGSVKARVAKDLLKLEFSPAYNFTVNDSTPRNVTFGL